MPKVRPADVLRVALAMIDRGAATASAYGNAFLQWHGPNDAGLWLGQSHGSAGVLQQLLAVDGVLSNSTAARLLRATLDHTCDVQMPSGNFPTEYYNASQDYLVQWDHGAPGVSAALLAGWRAFGVPRYRQAAERALDCTWERGLVLKGLMNCRARTPGANRTQCDQAPSSPTSLSHADLTVRCRCCSQLARGGGADGIGGNTWMMLYAARVTGDAKYLYRALSFQQTVLAHPLLSDLTTMRQPQPLPDGPWQFWTGSIESAIE
eukprot:1580338-Prymnesium_polylepis.1